MDCGIYEIKNTQNNKVYIGSAVALSTRQSMHKHHLKNGTHHNQHLQRAYDKYGKQSFTFSKLIICSEKDLIMYEQLCIDGFSATNIDYGYNICAIAGSTLGKKHTESTKRKIRIARRKQKNPRIGTTHSDETKKLLSKKANQYYSDPIKSKKKRKAVSEANKTRVVSEETKKKLSESLRAFWADPIRSKNARDKIKNNNKNYIFLRDKNNRFIGKLKRKK